MAVWIVQVFFSAAPTALNSQELKIHIRNVAQVTSVYYSVVFYVDVEPLASFDS